VTALKRVTSRLGVGEIQLDHLLKTKRFVDLYRVVQQAMIASENGYSLKDIEAFYMPPREAAVTSAVDSVVAYENLARDEGPGNPGQHRAIQRDGCAGRPS